jgi:dimethylsulfone monooxygenase
LPMAVSTVSLAGLDDADVERWSVGYAKEREHRFATPPTPQDVLDENLWGSPGKCVARIREYEEAGVVHLVIQPIPPLEGMRYFAREIMPALRDGSGAG